ncbi:MAG: glycogen debranching enzyme, partial [Actinomycetes bacterium]
QQRNFLATLLLSQGIPMILHGDEIGRSQRGNNNVYAQDNELAWMSWEAADADLLAFTRTLTEFRANHPVFRRRRFFDGLGSGEEISDISWFSPAGEHMGHDDWGGHARSITVFVNGEAIKEPDMRGEPVRDDSFLLLFNADHDDVKFRLPPAAYGETWTYEIDTNEVDVTDREPLAAEAEVVMRAHAMLVLRRAG